MLVPLGLAAACLLGLSFWKRKAAIAMGAVEVRRGDRIKINVTFKNTGEMDWTFGVGFTYRDSAGVMWDCYTGGSDKSKDSGGPGGVSIDSHLVPMGGTVTHVINNVPILSAVSITNADIISKIWKNPTVPPTEELASTGWLTGYLRITGIAAAQIISVSVEKA